VEEEGRVEEGEPPPPPTAVVEDIPPVFEVRPYLWLNSCTTGTTLGRKQKTERLVEKKQ